MLLGDRAVLGKESAIHLSSKANLQFKYTKLILTVPEGPPRTAGLYCSSLLPSELLFFEADSLLLDGCLGAQLQHPELSLC